MELSSIEFHKQAFNIINTYVNEAKKHGLSISSLPPHLAIISSTPTVCEEGHFAIAVASSPPEILQDIDPRIWSWVVKTKMLEENGAGFVFWCIIESSSKDEDVSRVFGYSYQLGGEFNAFFCDVELNNIQSVEHPFKVVPYLYDDYEHNTVLH
jgi:hypothetical protein